MYLTKIYKPHVTDKLTAAAHPVHTTKGCVFTKIVTISTFSLVVCNAFISMQLRQAGHMLTGHIARNYLMAEHILYS